MSRSKTLVSLMTAFAFLALGVVCYGSVTQVNLLGSSSGSISFTSPIGGPVSGTVSTLSGPANFELNGLVVDSGGSYTIGAGSFSMTSTNGGTTFSVGSNSESFLFTASGGDDLNGTITLTLVKDDTAEPNFIGSLLVSSVGGQLVGNYVIGGAYEFDFTLNGVSPTLSAIFKNGGSTSGGVSSGEIPTPEPASMLLFGSGLLGLGSFLRRRFRA